ncbi:MAG: TusE/DsrC/DsvC family sulfur relay protein [Cyclobacteriaceae bacterium]|nr:TusE/DsrC/DsvC family sulfur relay protein [Cyclobacteriaceae bacterium]
MEKTYEGISVDVNEEGYLTDLSQWTKEVGNGIAKEEGVEMTDKHWEVINYLQEQYRNENPLNIRKVGKSGVVSIKEFYALFPNGPLKVSSRVSGIPKPISCI